MSYLEKVLQPGEKILHRTKLSWTLYLPGLLMVVLVIVVYAVAADLLPPRHIWSRAALVSQRRAAGAPRRR